MKESFEKKINAQKSVIDAMESNISTWQNIPQLKSSYDSFVKNYKDITDCQNELDKSTDGLYIAGETSRSDLISIVFPVASVLSIYAADSGNKKLLSLSNLKYAVLESKTNKALLKTSGLIVSQSEKLIAKASDTSGKKKKAKVSILEYGLTTAHIEKVKQASDLHAKNLKAIRQFKDNRASCKTKASVKLEENEKLLKAKLDKFIHLFKNANPAFYSAYHAARRGEVIKATPQKAGPKTPAARKAPATGKPAAKKPAISKQADGAKQAASAKKTSSSKPPEA